MLIRLAWSSYKKQFRHYFVYLLSMSLSVMICYTFVAIINEQPLLKSIADNQNISGLLSIGSFMIMLILLMFMLSANRFFVERRQPELAILNLYGLHRRYISLMFIAEILLLGLLALGLGIFFGIFFSRLFFMILMRAIGVLGESRFFLSLSAIRGTFFIFLLFLAIVSVQTVWLLWGLKISRLFKRNTVKQNSGKRLSKFQWVLGIFSFILLGAAYLGAVFINEFAAFFAKSNGFIYSFIISLLIIASLGLSGTILFFKSGLHAAAALFKRRRQRYYKGLNLVATATIEEHAWRDWRSSSVISLLLSCGLLVIGAVALNRTFAQETLSQTDPVSFIISKEQTATFESLLAAKETEFAKQELTYKVAGIHTSASLYQNQPLEKNAAAIADFLPLSSYARYQKLNLHLPELRLASDTQAVALIRDRGLLYEHTDKNVTLNTAAGKFTIQQIRQNNLGEGNMRYGEVTFVVTDAAFEKITGVSYTLTAYALPESEAAISDAWLKQHATAWSAPITWTFAWQAGQLTGSIKQIKDSEQASPKLYRLNQTSRHANTVSARLQSGLQLYVVFFVVMVAILNTASMISVKQFSAAENQKSRYVVLRQAGASSHDLIRLVYLENAGAFLPPAGIAFLNAFFSVLLFYRISPSRSYWPTFLFSGILFAVYLIFYFATSTYYKRIVMEEG